MGEEKHDAGECNDHQCISVVSVIQKAQTAVSTAQRFRSRASAAAVAFDLHSFLRVASGRSG